MDDGTDAVVSVYGGGAADVVIPRQGHHGGGSAAVHEDSGVQAQLLAEGGEIGHLASVAGAVHGGGGGEHDDLPFLGQAQDGAGVVGVVAGLTRGASLLHEGEEARHGLGHACPLLLLGGGHHIRNDVGGQGHGVTHLELVGDAGDGTAAGRDDHGLVGDGGTLSGIPALEDGDHLTLGLLTDAEGGVGAIQVDLVGILKGEGLGAAALVVEDDRIGGGETVDAVARDVDVGGGVLDGDVDGGLTDHGGAVGLDGEDGAAGGTGAALHVILAGQVVLVVDLVGGPQLTRDNHGTAGNADVLDGEAGGLLAVTVVVGVVDDPGVAVDGGDDGAVAVSLVVGHGVVAHGVLGPGVRAAVEDSHGELVRQLQLHHADQAVSGGAVGRALLQEVLGQGCARLLAIDLDGGGVGLDRARQGCGGGRHTEGADPRQHGEAEEEGKDPYGEFHVRILSWVNGVIAQG